MEIVIKKSEEGEYGVSCEDKYANNLTYEEMIGVVISLTIPDNKPCLKWLKTKEQHDAYEKYLSDVRERNKK